MKRAGWYLLILILTLSGCGNPTAAPPEEAPDSPASTATSLPPSATATQAPTQEPSITPEPTATNTPEPSPTPLSAAISAENARQMELIQRRGDGAVYDLAFSPSAENIAILTSRSLKLYTAENGELLWEKSLDSVQVQIAFNEEGSQLVTLSLGGAVQYWNAETGEMAEEKTPGPENMEDISLSAYGDFLATRDKADQTWIWDAHTGQELTFNNGQSYPFGVHESAVSPDGEYFLISGVDSKRNFQIQLWRVSSSRRYARGLWGMAGFVNDLQFMYAADGKYVTGLGTKVVHGTDAIFDLYIWDAADGSLLDTVDLTNDTTDYLILGDGQTIIAARADGSIQKYSFRFNRAFLRDEIKVHDSPIAAIASSANGNVFATADTAGLVKIWDTAKLEEVGNFQIEDELSLQNVTREYEYNLDYYQETNSMIRLQHDAYSDISRDGTSRIVRTSPDLHSVQVLDYTSGEVLQELQIEYGSYYAAPVFSPDGKTVAAALDDEQIIFWDLESELDILRLTTSNKEQITEMQYTNDGQQIAAFSSGELLFWEPETRSLAKSLAGNQTFVISRDGSLIASDNVNQSIYLMDGENGKRITSLNAAFTYALDFSLDNSLLAAGGYEFRQSIWEHVNVVYFIDLETKRRLTTIELPGHAYTVMDVSYSPQGDLIVSIDGYGNLFIWDPDSGSMLKKFEEMIVLPADIFFSPDNRTLIVSNGDNTLHFFEIR